MANMATGAREYYPLFGNGHWLFFFDFEPLQATNILNILFKILTLNMAII